jgi:hypothetical protein
MFVPSEAMSTIEEKLYELSFRAIGSSSESVDADANGVIAVKTKKEASAPLKKRVAREVCGSMTSFTLTLLRRVLFEVLTTIYALTVNVKP